MADHVTADDKRINWAEKRYRNIEITITSIGKMERTNERDYMSVVGWIKVEIEGNVYGRPTYNSTKFGGN